MLRNVILITIAVFLAVSHARAATTRPSTSPSPVDTTASDADADLGAPATDGSPELGLYQDIPVVVAASKYAENIHQAAASVSVVTDDDIELFNYRSLADVLRNQRGFYLDTDGLNWFAGTRGFLRSGEWNARLLVLLDDRPTNEIIFGQSHLDPDFVVPMEAVKQVEIIRGPGSALYGTDAVFGVINAVTKDGADVNGAEVKLEAGSDYTVHGNALVGFTADGWDILGDLAGFSSDGTQQVHFDDVSGPEFNNGNIDNSDKSTNDEGFFKAKKGEFTAEVDFEDRAQGNEYATYLADFTNPGTMDEHRVNSTLSVDHDMGNGQSLHAMAYYGYYGYYQPYGIAATGSTPAYEYTSTAYDDWIGEDIHYDWQPDKQIHLLAGADGTQGLDAHQHDYDALQGDVLNISQSYNSYALFAQGEFQLADWLNITAGGRFDRVQRLGNNISPRIGAIVTPDKEDTFKALYGRAFRDPNLYELFYDSPGSNTPNPNLKAEVVDTYELDWERQYENGWQSSLSAYLWHMDNTMDNVTLGDGSEQTQNVGSSLARGLEAEVDKRWDTRASFRAYATYTWTQQNGMLPPLSPQWIAGTALAVPFDRNNFLSVDPQIVGPMKSDLGNYTRATYITNIVFTSEHIFKSNWTFQIGVYSLFADNARLPYGGAFEQAETTLPYPATQYLASMTCKF